jgi:hypothetical protein
MSDRLVIRAAHDGDALRLETNLGQIDPCLHGAAFGALARHLGYDGQVMELAVQGGPDHEPPDPRYPWLQALIARARRDWVLWGERLTEAVSRMLKAGKLLPMTAKSEQALLDLFRDHQVEIVVKFAGSTPDRTRLMDLVKRGLVSPGVENESYIDAAYKIGRGLEALEPHVVPDGPPDEVLKEKLKEALRYKLTPRDEKAIEFMKRQGALLMRRPAETYSAELERVVQHHGEARLLTEGELGAIRSTVSAAIRREGSGDLARDLRDAVKGTNLQNDMDRVARTELANAHCFGGYVTLKEKLAAQGINDPEVYKFVSPYACKDCRRIWGDPANPIRYRLSFIEAREARGGNFGLPHAEWGPVIGTVHPNCTEGPLQYWQQALVESINRAADRFLKAQGRF